MVRRAVRQAHGPEQSRRGIQLKLNIMQILSGSRLASATAGLGRDDTLGHSLLRGEGTCSYPAELNGSNYFSGCKERLSPLPNLGACYNMSPSTANRLACHIQQVFTDSVRVS